MPENNNLKILSRSLKAISKINRVLLSFSSEKKLCQTICNDLVQIKGYKFVWMGLKMNGNGIFSPIAIMGKDKDFVKSVKETWGKYSLSGCPTSIALKRGRHFLNKDLKNVIRFVPWDKKAIKEGFLQAFVLPLRYHSDVIGTLHVYSDMNNYFLKEERSFLKEVAGDIGLGIKNIKDDRKSITRKIEYKELFKRMSSCVDIYTASGNGNDFIIKDFNKAAEKADKIKRKDVIGRSVLEVFPGVKDFGLFDVFKRVYKTGKPESHPISNYKDKRISGWRENFVYKLPNTDVVAVYNDLTEKKKAEEEIISLAKFPQESPSLIGRIGYDGKILYCNPACKRIFKDKDHILSKLKSSIKKIAAKKSYKPEDAEIEVGDRIFLFNLIPIKKENYVNFYGTDITERKQAEHALKERYKELSCLYNVTSIAELRNISLDKLLERTVMLLPPAWQFPEITEACITLEGLTFQTERFRETSWMQVSKIVVDENTIGQVKICYLEKRQESDEGPFLREERILIDTIALKLGQLVLRIRSEENLHESEEKYRTLVEKVNEAILIVQDGNFVFANSKTYELTGMSDRNFVGKSFIDFVWPEDREMVVANYAKRIAGETIDGVYDFRIISAEGEPVWVIMSVALIQYKGRPATLLMVTNIADRKKAEQEILQLSFHDHLTGLSNRRLFEEELNRLNTKRQLPLGFIMGDLNGLKLINDVFGHTEGDGLLVKTAEILKKVCRSDDILARWGGDEFVLLLPKTSAQDAEDIVARIKKECKKTNKQKIPLSLSLGASTKETSAQDIQAIIIDAESNMYKNKLAHKESISNSVIFALEQALYEKSYETKEHTESVRDYALKLGKSVNLSSSQLDELSLLSSLHDIGKVAISETILSKDGKLTKKEWEVIKRHPEIGFNIASSSPQIAHIAKAILACHENFDGSGYPLGIAGESIPVISRIIFISDTYDVMTRGRIYKEAMSKDDEIKELKKCAGSQFDPMLIDKFIEIISK